MSYLLKFDCILLILCLVSSFTFAFNNSGFPELSLGESSGFTLHFILTFSAKKCILYINTMLSFEGDKNEKIQKDCGGSALRRYDSGVAPVSRLAEPLL